MKQFILIVTLLLSFYCYSQVETKYFFIRHAEKNEIDKTDRNPELTEKGEQRAIYWSEVLNNVNFDEVYSTNYNRTIKTALPIAAKNNLEIQFYNPRELNSDIFKHETKGKTILIVGHSNTTPTFVNKVIGKEKYAQIEEHNNSNLYIVTINNSGTMDILLKIEHKKSH